MADDLLVARGLVVAYGRPAAMFARRSVAPAVLSGIDIHVGKGETVGIVGESGSGKTTLGRALLGLVKPVAGSVIFDGRDITALDEKARRPLRRRMQMIFQDPMSSLNPRHTIGRILTEPVLLHGLAQDHAAALALVQGVLDRVGLQRNTVERYSFELSGGQRQRVGIARAVVLRSGLMERKVDFVACDMPSANAFMINVYAAVAQEERRMISDRTKAGLAAAKARGVKLGGPTLPAINERRQARALERARAIAPILSELAGMSARSVAAELNARQVETPSGAPWSAKTVIRARERLAV